MTTPLTQTCKHGITVKYGEPCKHYRPIRHVKDLDYLVWVHCDICRARITLAEMKRVIKEKRFPWVNMWTYDKMLCWNCASHLGLI